VEPTSYLAAWGAPELAIVLGLMAIALALDLAAVSMIDEPIIKHIALCGPMQWLGVMLLVWLFRLPPEWVFVVLIVVMLPRLVSLLSQTTIAVPDRAVIRRKAVVIRKRMRRSEHHRRTF
jgi:hypothetical protein